MNDRSANRSDYMRSKCPTLKLKYGWSGKYSSTKASLLEGTEKVVAALIAF